MSIFGIDVSKWQGNFDFARAKSEGVKFAILRGAYSAPSVADGGKDTSFEDYYKKAKAAGLNVGVYQYSMAQTVAQAKAEAEYFYTYALKGKQFDCPVYIDVEDASQKKLGKRLLTDIVKAWCAYLEGKNYFVGIYASKSFFGDYLYDGELTRYTHWVAQWANACTYVPASSLGMWQFGGETNTIRTNKVAGVVCDQDYMLKDFPSAIKAAGKNGYTVANPVAKPAAIQHKIDGYNAQRRTNQLIIYNNGKNANTNKWGSEVQVNSNGYILCSPVYGKGKMIIPSGGYVLSGHGSSSDWVSQNCKAGNKLTISGGYVKVTKANIKVGDKVKVLSPVIYGTKTKFKLWYDTYTVMSISGDKAVIGVDGVATSPIAIGNLVKI